VPARPGTEARRRVDVARTVEGDVCDLPFCDPRVASPPHALAGVGVLGHHRSIGAAQGLRAGDRGRPSRPAGDGAAESGGLATADAFGVEQLAGLRRPDVGDDRQNGQGPEHHDDSEASRRLTETPPDSSHSSPFDAGVGTLREVRPTLHFTLHGQHKPKTLVKPGRRVAEDTAQTHPVRNAPVCVSYR